jgi:hypothetical protein
MLSEGIEYAPDSLREVRVYLHPSASPAHVLSGVAADAFDLTSFSVAVRQSSNTATVELSWHDELYGDAEPRIGQVLEISLQGVSYWIGLIDGMDDHRLSSGDKRLTVRARSRDATPAWRDTRRTTQIYPTATPLGYIARQIAQSCGMQSAEIALPNTGQTTVHSNTQLADLTPWQMLTTLLQPSGLEPYVDARGRLKTISRDLTRASDIVLEDNRRLVKVSGAKGRPQLTEMRIRWLDPKLAEVSQVTKVLATKTITAGFFQLKQEQDIWFSADQTQRARETYMVVRQSANSGLLPVCKETYAQLSTTKGTITLKTHAWVPGLAIGAMAVKLAAHSTPDIAPPGGGPTSPVGRKLEFAADAVILLTMMSIGTGSYEVWGTPYDYVHVRNTTTAYNRSANVWEIKPQEIENDFVMNDDQAHTFAVRELVYQYSAATSYNLTIVDDTRIERGDIIELRNGTRIYVTEYSRDLSHGAPALLEINGFLLNAVGAVGAQTVLVHNPVPVRSSMPDVPGYTLPPGSGLTPVDPTDPGYSAYQSYGPWTMLPNMPEARNVHSAFVFGGQLLHVGGNHRALGFEKSDGYQMWLDPSTGTWDFDTADGLPGGAPTIVIGEGQLVCSTVAHYGGKVYAIGRSYNGTGASVWEYDPDNVYYSVNSHWHILPIATPWVISTQYGALVDDTVYYPTVGKAINLETSTVVDIASIQAITGEGGIMSTCVQALGGKVYVLGVGNLNISGASCTRTYIYDPATDTITSGVAAPESIWGATAVVLGGAIHVFGGAKGGASYDHSDRHLTYTPATNKWSSKAKLPPATYLDDGKVLFGPGVFATPQRAGFSAVAYNGKIYIAGGGGFIAPDGGSTTLNNQTPPSMLTYRSMTFVYDPGLDA